jgi:hypothetical protein
MFIMRTESQTPDSSQEAFNHTAFSATLRELDVNHSNSAFSAALRDLAFGALRALAPDAGSLRSADP